MPTSLLVVLIAVTELGSPAAGALVRAATEALGPSARVLLRADDSAHGQPALGETAESTGAAAVARLVWADADRTRASVHVFLPALAQTLQQDVAFRASDSLAERGRTLGLVIVALTISPAAPRGPPLAATDRGVSAVVAAPVAVASPPASAVTSPYCFEALLAGGLATGGSGGGVGGGIAVRRRMGEWGGARIGARVRTGRVDVAQSSSVDLGASAGLFGVLGEGLVGGERGRGLSLVLRADILLLYEGLTHYSSDDPEPVHQGAFLPGASSLLEGEWWWSANAAFVLSAGVEVAFGVTEIQVRQRAVARLAPVRGVAELGFRVRF